MTDDWEELRRALWHAVVAFYLVDGARNGSDRDDAAERLRRDAGRTDEVIAAIARTAALLRERAA
jgi:hypothetical protein